MIKLGILASTRATDMQAIIDAIESKKLDARISIVISNKEDAYALERARKHNIDAVFVNPKGLKREEFDNEVNKVLDKHNVDLVLLIGYMRILSNSFVTKWKNRLMNIHPSLLPDFAGSMDMDVHAAVLKSGIKFTGCTLHFVDENVDSGPIILQKKVNIDKNETAGSLKEKVQKAEQEIIIKGIKLFGESKIVVKNSKAEILE
ncbi:phosphoribosylglycinamide formyltransferase [Candidatus Woesearchaeota archaeon]|nr:phosphoribosylglycinamide formyltransferase [Candidatus Woesearchaeota archaeon]